MRQIQPGYDMETFWQFVQAGAAADIQLSHALQPGRQGGEARATLSIQTGHLFRSAGGKTLHVDTAGHIQYENVHLLGQFFKSCAAAQDQCVYCETLRHMSQQLAVTQVQPGGHMQVVGQLGQRRTTGRKRDAMQTCRQGF